MTKQVRVLEHVGRRAPLGMRLVDIVNAQQVSGGFDVFAYATSRMNMPLIAQRSPVSGIYGYRTLPGLTNYVDGIADADVFCPDPNPDANFVITIIDQQRRFLQQVMQICLPRTEVVDIPLFTSPTRNLAGYAVIRGFVTYEATPNNDVAASWALIQIDLNGSTYMALSAENGEFLVYVPYPPVSTADNFGSVTLDELEWTLTISARFQPSIQETLFPSNTRLPPHISSINAQNSAQVVGNIGDGAQASINAHLIYGRGLLLQTDGESFLRLDPP